MAGARNIAHDPEYQLRLAEARRPVQMTPELQAFYANALRNSEEAKAWGQTEEDWSI
jgi:hypothetical protein